jgi:hypothetical protein
MSTRAISKLVFQEVDGTVILPLTKGVSVPCIVHLALYCIFSVSVTPYASGGQSKKKNQRRKRLDEFHPRTTEEKERELQVAHKVIDATIQRAGKELRLRDR